jgi:hypothetical protein
LKDSSNPLWYSLLSELFACNLLGGTDMKNTFFMMMVVALSLPALASPICKLDTKNGLAAYVDDNRVTPHQIGGDGLLQVPNGVVALVKAGVCVPPANVPKCDIKFNGATISFYYGDDVLATQSLNQDANALYNFGTLMSNLKTHKLCN